jgi:hypothetical protein
MRHELDLAIRISDQRRNRTVIAEQQWRLAAGTSRAHAQEVQDAEQAAARSHQQACSAAKAGNTAESNRHAAAAEMCAFHGRWLQSACYAGCNSGDNEGLCIQKEPVNQPAT